MIIARIDENELTAEDFVKLLKLGGTFDNLIEDLVIDKLTVHAAKRHGITVSNEEVQERVDQIRRIKGLHRAKDTVEFLNDLGVCVDEFANWITEILYKEKMIAEINKDESVEEYFALHSPRFDSIEVSHIVVESEGKAKELLSLLEEEPECFAEMAREHSLDMETKEKGGFIGKVLRGSLHNEIEARVFNASAGDLLGPFPTPDGLLFEIFKVNAKNPAQLDASTVKEIRKLIYQEWLEARAQEHKIEML